MKKPSLEVFCKSAKSLFLPTILKRFRNKEDAEDAFGHAMYLVIREWKKIPDNPELFFWRTIQNIRLEKYRDKKMDSIDFDFDQPDTEDPRFLLVHQEHNELLKKVILSLPQDKQEICFDYLFMNYQYNEKKKKYVVMDAEAYCEKYKIKKTTLYQTIHDVANQMRTLLKIEKQPVKS
ncbi:MAG TPA: hypothetical protein VGQ59_07445 [Cyclobacteriaceae bacterium]|jgi:hypothetical protein|nr:hypothetical protein [Cyclobacteriaceae bacterium]